VIRQYNRGGIRSRPEIFNDFRTVAADMKALLLLELLLCTFFFQAFLRFYLAFFLHIPAFTHATKPPN
jgi:hypothetical protein